MAAISNVRIHSPGAREVLNSRPVANALAPLASTVASEVSRMRPEADVVVDTYTTDRTATSVTARHPQAMLWQARDGLMTQAASVAGLTVRSR